MIQVNLYLCNSPAWHMNTKTSAGSAQPGSHKCSPILDLGMVVSGEVIGILVNDFLTQYILGVVGIV